MDALRGRFRQLAERIDALSVRERGLVFLAVLGTLALIAFNVVFAPLQAQRAVLERQLKASNEKLEATNRQMEALFAGAGALDSNERIRSLNDQIARLDADLDRTTTGVVSPKEMTRLVEQMLSRNRNLELLRLESLPPESLDGVKQTVVTALPATSDVLVYRHGMRIEIRGRYFDIVEYLKAIEGMQWKVFWGAVELEADEYPYSRVTLTMYTLSRHAGWIGV